ncbi:hypothetical protein DBZ36_05745 [Alginatibacterium sediminis]|uniref:Uncharacterized protein n=1 Tax=Alginatibacterium sediminis TaxID=2164068 RepID=A0A420EH13_9ALTE|nr:hypothetical protein DBZ36_05745 [Alginatibacterium sediminis]
MLTRKSKRVIRQSIEVRNVEVQNGSIVVIASIVIPLLVSATAGLFVALLTQKDNSRVKKTTTKAEYDLLMIKLSDITEIYCSKAAGSIRHRVSVDSPDRGSSPLVDFYFSPTDYEEAKRLVDKAIDTYNMKR